MITGRLLRASCCLGEITAPLVSGRRPSSGAESRLPGMRLSFGRVSTRDRSLAVKEELFGNTEGLKASQSKRLLATYRRRVHQSELCSAELARHLTEVSREVGRQIGVLINRRGEIENVVVGDAHQLTLPDIGRERAGSSRLRGIRLVHTHLKDEKLTRDDLTDLVLLRLDAVAAIVAREDGLPGRVYVGTLVPFDAKKPGGELSREEMFESIFDIGNEFEGEPRRSSRRWPAPRRRARWAAKGARSSREFIPAEISRRRKRRCWSCANCAEPRASRWSTPCCKGGSRWTRAPSSARESCRTSWCARWLWRRTCSSSIAISRPRNRATSATSPRCGSSIALSSSSIFSRAARRAPTASCRSNWPSRNIVCRDWSAPTKRSRDWPAASAAAVRARRNWRWIAGARAIGSSGWRSGSTGSRPIARCAGGRGGARTCRRSRSSATPTRARARCSTRSPIRTTLVEDKLFATLDPTSRRLRFPKQREVVLTDTVGFIRDLPKDLVAAFRATLEELEDADLLLHVVDASDARAEQQIESVERILATLPLKETPRLFVFNKMDRAPQAAAQLAHQRNGVAISASTKQGFDGLLARAEQVLWREGKVQAPGDLEDGATFLGGPAGLVAFATILPHGRRLDIGRRQELQTAPVTSIGQGSGAGQAGALCARARAAASEPAPASRRGGPARALALDRGQRHHRVSADRPRHLRAGGDRGAPLLGEPGPGALRAPRAERFDRPADARTLSRSTPIRPRASWASIATTRPRSSMSWSKRARWCRASWAAG